MYTLKDAFEEPVKEIILKVDVSIMAQQQWQVEPVTGVCAVSGKKFEEGDEFYTVLFEEGETFRRVDYCIDAWEGSPKDSFCYFKTRVPVKQKRKKLLVNNELLTNFFIRLEDETEPVRVQFRFVIALILMRKRLLRYIDSKTKDNLETWNMTMMPDRSAHTVVNPQLTDDQIEGVSAQLSAILHGDMGEWAESQDYETNPSSQEPEAI